MSTIANIESNAALSAHHEGSTYSYALDEEGNARILRCVTHERRVAVPEVLDGHAVTAIAHSAFAGLDATESLALPASISQIGWNAFANCPRLRRIALPAGIGHLDKTWLADCPQLADVVLPAAAETIDADFLKSCHPARLVIGSGTRMVDAPPFVMATLREVVVDAANPHLSTDGACLYSKDGSVLLKCLVENAEYRVQDGCRRIGERAFAYAARLARIALPDCMESIGASAFLGTSLTAFKAPANLRVIGERAFARCAKLERVNLGASLEELGESAFYQCERLERLAIPASARRLGQHLLDETPLDADGPDATFTIDAENPVLFVRDGILYERQANGQVLADALDPRMVECAVLPGTTAIRDSAFAGHAALERVELPEGLTAIGAEAFSGCGRLRSINLPSTLTRIGTRGLFNTALEALTIPAGLQSMGSCALAIDGTDGRVPALRERTLRSVCIDPGNTRFYMKSGLLCEHIGGYARAVLYIGPQTDVTVPAEVNEIGPHAFAGVKGLTKLALHSGITHIGTLGLALAEPPEVLEIEYEEPGADTIQTLRIHPIHDQRGLRAMRNAFAEGRIDTPLLAEGMDRMALYSRNPLERARYMVERLADPHLLSHTMHANYDLNMRRSLVSSCVVGASGGWLGEFDLLADMGYLDEETITPVIDAVTAAGHVAATAYLIKLKRRRWPADRDYSL